MEAIAIVPQRLTRTLLASVGCALVMSAFSTELRARLPEHQGPFMDTIEQSLGNWIDRHTRFAELAHDAAGEVVGTGHQSALALIASQAANIASRVVGLTEAFIALANDDSVYAAPAVVRALHETCCVPCYMARELLPRLEKGNRKAVNDLRRILYRLGLGTGPGAGFGRLRPIPVDGLNRAATFWVTDYLTIDGTTPPAADRIIRMIYAPLSDRTHPNFGATTPGMSLNPAGQATYWLRPQFDGDSIDQLLSGTYFMLLVAGEALDNVIAVAKQRPTPFPPGDPEWHPDDLVKPGEASILETG
jgi:hypothetical protein